jgi:hypothetical protein
MDLYTRAFLQTNACQRKADGYVVGWVKTGGTELPLNPGI